MPDRLAGPGANVVAVGAQQGEGAHLAGVGGAHPEIGAVQQHHTGPRVGVRRAHHIGEHLHPVAYKLAVPGGVFATAVVVVEVVQRGPRPLRGLPVGGAGGNPYQCFGDDTGQVVVAGGDGRAGVRGDRLGAVRAPVRGGRDPAHPQRETVPVRTVGGVHAAVALPAEGTRSGEAVAHDRTALVARRGANRVRGGEVPHRHPSSFSPITHKCDKRVPRIEHRLSGSLHETCVTTLRPKLL